jgi:transcription elongation factor Elf1
MLSVNLEGIIPQLATRVRNYRKVAHLYRFSCPLCGDSKSDKTKARGYIYRGRSGYVFHCHNCNAHSSLRNFFKAHFPDLYKEALLETFQPKRALFEDISKQAETSPTINLLLLPITKDINAEPGRDYLRKRQIPESQWDRLFYVEDLRSLSCLDKKYIEVLRGQTRHVLLPMYDRLGRLFAISARNIEPQAKLRYLMMKIREDHETIFGLDKHDMNQRTYVLEGPFDSLFFPNALAVNTSDLTRASPFIDKSRSVLIFDNQYRNRNVVEMMLKAQSQGYSVFVWPASIRSKDMNEVVINKEALDVAGMVEENTYSGTRLRLELSRRINVSVRR